MWFGCECDDVVGGSVGGVTSGPVSLPVVAHPVSGHGVERSRRSDQMASEFTQVTDQASLYQDRRVEPTTVRASVSSATAKHDREA